MILLRLFWEFFITGLFSIGGGLATLPFLERISEKTGWFTLAQLGDMVAVAECTPGPIGINVATYAGYTTAGFFGGLAATFGLVLPSFLCILFVAAFLDKWRHNRAVEGVFDALRPASAALICTALVSMAGLTMIDADLFYRSRELADLFKYKEIALGCVVFVLFRKFGKSPVFYLLACGVVGVVLKL